MRRLLIAFAVAAFVAAGAAQPSGAGPNMAGGPDSARQGQVTTMGNQSGNQTGNETRGNVSRGPGRSAQFDARLMTAINTVDALTKIAPNDDVEQRLERALEILRNVKEDTDTASLGPDNETSDEDTGERGPPADRGPGQQGPPEDAGSSGQQGPQNRGRQGGGPPGFVRRMLGGLFG
ncbi:MAG: hypothetical protein ABEJ07_06380 [Candidatus Nanohaloarchaea archaeon]